MRLSSHLPLCAVVLAIVAVISGMVAVIAPRSHTQPAAASAETKAAIPYNYPPGCVVYWEFPDLPPTLFTYIFPDRAKWNPPRVSVRIPDTYTPDRRFPMAVFLGGYHGGEGLPNISFNKTFGKDTVCVYLPLFKQHVEPMADDESNKWKRARIQEEDSEISWNAYKIMLTKVFEMVPNIDREQTFMGGFSNGGHITAALLNRPRARDEIMSIIKHFYFVEGGAALTQVDVLRDTPVIFIQGGDHKKAWLRAAYDRAVEAGAPAEWYIMEGVGHEFAPSGWQRLRQWMVSQTQP